MIRVVHSSSGLWEYKNESDVKAKRKEGKRNTIQKKEKERENERKRKEREKGKKQRGWDIDCEEEKRENIA